MFLMLLWTTITSSWWVNERRSHQESNTYLQAIVLISKLREPFPARFSGSFIFHCGVNFWFYDVVPTLWTLYRRWNDVVWRTGLCTTHLQVFTSEVTWTIPYQILVLFFLLCLVFLWRKCFTAFFLFIYFIILFTQNSLFNSKCNALTGRPRIF